MTRRVVPADTTAADKAQARVRKHIRRWSATLFPVRFLDADESPDPIEFVGYSVVRQDIIAKPTGCMDCPERSDACDNCKLSEGDSDDEENRELARLITPGILSRFASRSKEGAYLGQMLQAAHYHEGLHDLFFAAPPFRGARMAAELRTRERMNF
ncbi:hypothetical protein A2950_00495 [Candidatus Kaiserbacteria bacterium RIFCSPLOWO2_01_FULL_55_19]|uniref:Uncharacterized protein n=1 Tax=Candidatus Kaiserbacteria bacterium RIFCSPLOWO2_01_FULL_55_19 TaxID=1798516 RepID=A0A1F6ES24_9BACT|nr:MAG: hypothetical protein A2950_00495 [Candidatus Kaiserbacteria bacterium RIFCSPLOWO2_01_FULL_55_19]